MLKNFALQPGYSPYHLHHSQSTNTFVRETQLAENLMPLLAAHCHWQYLRNITCGVGRAFKGTCPGSPHIEEDTSMLTNSNREGWLPQINIQLLNAKLLGVQQFLLVQSFWTNQDLIIFARVSVNSASTGRKKLQHVPTDMCFWIYPCSVCIPFTSPSSPPTHLSLSSEC